MCDVQASKSQERRWILAHTHLHMCRAMPAGDCLEPPCDAGSSHYRRKHGHSRLLPLPRSFRALPSVPCTQQGTKTCLSSWLHHRLTEVCLPNNSSLAHWAGRRQAGRQVPSQSLSEADSNNTQLLAGQDLFSSWWNSWHFSSLPMLVLGRKLVFLGSQGPPPQHQQSGNQAAGSGCQVAAPRLQDCSLDSAKARHEGKHSISFLSSLPNPVRIPV